MENFNFECTSSPNCGGEQFIAKFNYTIQEIEANAEFEFTIENGKFVQDEGDDTTFNEFSNGKEVVVFNNQRGSIIFSIEDDKFSLKTGCVHDLTSTMNVKFNLTPNMKTKILEEMKKCFTAVELSLIHI